MMMKTDEEKKDFLVKFKEPHGQAKSLSWPLHRKDICKVPRAPILVKIGQFHEKS